MGVDGLEALEILASESVDLLLTDVVMPALGGIELVREVRSRNPDVRCLLMTGYSAEAVPTDPISMSESLISKPFTTADLLRMIRRQLDAD